MWTTAEVPIPSDPFSCVIGQDEAVRIARIITKQRRNLLLVGPPGVGKSMVAWAVSSSLPPACEEISILHNPECPERPVCESRRRENIDAEEHFFRVSGRATDAADIPFHAAERLGFRCRRCAAISSCNIQACPKCGFDKYRLASSPFDELVTSIDSGRREKRVQTTIKNTVSGADEVFLFESASDSKARVFNANELEKLKLYALRRPRKILVPLGRKTFIQATGASETELLGDVKHDPYGGHAELGTQPYARVVPGAIHEAHEGVLFIDELSSMGRLQRFILTAMQEKKFPISGKNPSSTGSSVRVDGVPCNFIFVSALNINDLAGILPPLRSRIAGDGYEVLLNTHMGDTKENRDRLLQFMRQEIEKDGRIPHANEDAAHTLIEEARKRAGEIDNAHDSLTLRLRGLSGVIKLAGDLAVFEGAQLIEKKHITLAIEKNRSVEEQLHEKYGSAFKAGMSDLSFREGRERASDIT